MNESEARTRIGPYPSDAVLPVTLDAAPQATAPDRSRVAPKLSVVSRSLPAMEGEIRDLLHARLRVIAVLSIVGWTSLLAFRLLNLDGLLDLTTLQTWGGVANTAIATMCVTIFASAVIELVLFRFRDISSFWLRLHELLIFGLSAVALAWIRHAMLYRALEQQVSNVTVQRFSIVYASVYSNLGWMTLITVYGVFVPNTWRRTLAVVAGMGAAVFAVDVMDWLAFPDLVRGYVAAPAVMTSLTLFMAIGTAVFGSFKISSLQTEAFEARHQMHELGQYHLQRLLGVGGMGEVYLAEHRLLKRPCAVKLIRPERAGDPQILARFEREVQATARLRHPNTVEVYDYGRTDDGTFYYVMEFLDGIGLDELVKQHGPLPPGRALHFARQICGALREAHGQGLIHRDIKPGNVLVCRQAGVHDVAKLVDFGLVQTLDDDPHSSKLTRDGHIVGTPDYMSPEQANNPRLLDHRTDIYSLGGLLYFMLAGRPPFVRNTLIDTLIAHQHDAVEPLRAVQFDVPLALERIVLNCLAKEPPERYADAAELERALGDCGDVATWTDEDAARWWQTNRSPA